MGEVTEAHRAANARYDKTNTRQLKLKLNVNTDADILAWLEAQPNKQGAVKSLIRRAAATQYTNRTHGDIV